MKKVKVVQPHSNTGIIPDGSPDIMSTTLKSSKIWLEEGLGSIPKRTHDWMMKWKCIDMGELTEDSSGEDNVRSGCPSRV